VDLKKGKLGKTCELIEKRRAKLICQFCSFSNKQYQVFFKEGKIRSIYKEILTSVIIVKSWGIGQENILILDNHWGCKLNHNNNNNSNSNNSNNINMHYRVRKLENGNGKREEMRSYLSLLLLTKEGGKVRLEWCGLGALMLSVNSLMVCVTESYLEGGEKL
jgi:hypothetical protein